MFLLLFLKIYFNDFCQTNYLYINWTDLHKICTVGGTLAVDEGFEDLQWKQIFWAKSTSIPHFVVRMTLARAAPPAYDKKDSCYTGRRQTNYLIHWTQANKLSNTLIINRRLEG